MRKISILFSFLISLIAAQGVVAQSNPQITNLFYEDFDDTTNIQMTSSSTSGTNSWGISWIHSSPQHSDTGRVAFKDTIFLTTPTFYIDTFNSVSFEFDHVAKVNWNDQAKVQVSFDKVTWIDLTENSHQGPTDLMPDNNNANLPDYRFTDQSTLQMFNLWQWGIRTWRPSGPSDFVHEVFEISNVLQNYSGPKDSATFRFFLGDDITQDSSQTDPHNGMSGWYIDNISIKGAKCRLIAPAMQLFMPQNYIQQYEGSVYHEGPFDFTVEATDDDGVESVLLIYSLREANDTFWQPEDTIAFVKQAGATYTAEIPVLNIKDSVCWRIEAVDVTVCENLTVIPVQGCTMFEVRQTLPAGCGSTPINVYPYSQTFNSPGVFPVTTNPTTPPATVPLGERWTNTTGDHIDWWVGSGATPTVGTGPDNDYPGGGKYLYVESTFQLDKTANLKSPCIDLYEITNPNVSYYINTFGQSNGFLHVDLYTFEGPVIKDIVPPVRNSITPNWEKQELNLYDYRNKIVQLRFRGETGINEFSDLALDSVRIFHSPLVDLAGVRVLLDEFAPAGSQDSVDIVVRNLGVHPLDSGLVYLSPNGEDYINYPAIEWYNHIPPGATDTITVYTPFVIPLGEYSMEAYVHLKDTNNVIGDERASNDTTNVAFGRGLPTIDLVTKDAYIDGFEDGDSLWTAAPFNSSNTNIWELGYPNFGQTTGTFEGDNAWDINLDASYTNSEETVYLISPFMDLTASDTVILSFMQNRDIRPSDILYLEFSRDRGETWETFDPTADPHRKGWYNATVLTPNGVTTQGWNGSSRVLGDDGQPRIWQYSEFSLAPLADTSKERDEILLRFSFYDKAVETDGGGSGVSIDGLRIVDLKPHDVFPLEINKPFSNCRLSDSEEVIITLENFGTQHLDTIPVRVNAYNDNGTIVDWFTERVNVQLAYRNKDTYTLNGTLDLSNVGEFYTIELITTLANDQVRLNDTITRRLENIDGCNIILEMLPTGGGGSGNYQFYFDNQIPEYPAYLNLSDMTMEAGEAYFDSSYCARDGSFVVFDLNDPDSAINEYHIINELTGHAILSGMIGGPRTEPAEFTMVCPYPTDAIIRSLNIVRDEGIVPIAMEYDFEIEYSNKGIYDIETIDVKLQVDNGQIYTFKDTNDPAIPYSPKRKKMVIIEDVYIEPGMHTITAWLENPNGVPDDYPQDDTARMAFNVADTANTDICADGYSTDFESMNRPLWISYNPYDYSIRSLFEKGTPSKGNMQGARSGNNAWVTDLDNEYRAFDSSSLVSPFFYVGKDMCYSINFYHMYSFDDRLHDGGHFQYSTDTGRTWKTIYAPHWNRHALNWYQSDDNIPSIPDNANNGGWTGVEDSAYVNSRNKYGSYEDGYVLFRFRFESDGPPNGDGWVIDDFSLSCISYDECFTVGFEEQLAGNNFLLGQNQPNPFNNSTEIPIYLPISGMLDVLVLNVLGQPVYQSQERMGEGEHFIELQTSEWSSGVYYYTVMFDGQKQTKKMMITR